ncbi:MAG: protein kinase, partial [Holophagales bacterium]|nr:protein kinase [Holophagales bacterium]
ISSSAKARARFLREARAIAGIRHSAIVQIYDLLEHEGSDWIVMELLEGRSLAEELGGGPLPVERCLEWGIEIAAGLDAAHGQGIVHRDLKPANVFLTHAGQAKILDFGLAKQLLPGDGEEDSLSFTGAVIGTGSAMSPEQAAGLAVDYRSDLFSFGSLLYQMATGASPFRANSLAETLHRLRHHHPTPAKELRPEVPGAFSELVEQLHEKAPELRPASAESARARLEAIRASVAAGRGEPSDDSLTLPAPDRPIGTMKSAGRVPAGSPLTAGIPREKASPDWRAWVGPLAWLLFLGVILGWGVSLLPEGDGNPLAGVEAAAEGTAPSEAGAGELESGGIDAGESLRDLPLRELYARGQALLERYDQDQNLARAEEMFRHMLHADPESALAHTGLAQAYWWQYQDLNRDPSFLVKARGAADRAVALDPRSADARTIRAVVLFHQGQPEEARGELDTALRLEPGHAGAHFRLGEILDGQGETAAAEESFLAAIRADPYDRRYQDALGALYLKTARYEEAVGAFRSSVELAPDVVFGYRNLAAAYYMLGRYSEAAGELQTALEIEPRPSLYTNLGTLLFIQGLYQEAVVAFEQALELGNASNHYQYWANLADAYRWSITHEAEAPGTYLRAIQLLRQELDRQPENPTLRSRLALYQAKRGDPEGARETLGALADAEALDASSLYRVAVAHELIGNRPQALEAIGEALRQGHSRKEIQLDPELEDLRSDLGFHRLLAELEGEL